MSITRHTIRRLEREAEAINPDKDLLRFCWQDGTEFYCNINKTHRQITMNVSKEVLKQNDINLKGIKQTV